MPIGNVRPYVVACEPDDEPCPRGITCDYCHA